MKTLKSKITVKDTVATIISFILVALFVWWGMHFPAPSPATAQALVDSNASLHTDGYAHGSASNCPALYCVSESDSYAVSVARVLPSAKVPTARSG